MLIDEFLCKREVLGKRAPHSFTPPLSVVGVSNFFPTEGMFNAFFQECFINGLKDEIWAHVLMARPQSWVEATKRDKEEKHVISS